MSKLLKVAAATLLLSAATASATYAQDAKAGAKVFKKCKACHAVGDGAKNKVGPELNELFGRAAGGVEGFKYSKAFKKANESGIVWNDETLAQFLAKPKAYIKGTKMSFAGLKKDKDVANILAYLKTFSAGAEAPAVEEATPKTEPEQESKAEPAAKAATAMVDAKDAVIPTHGVLHLGRAALKEEVAAWDIDVRPDGKGLPEGKGTVAQGEAIFAEQCAVCHGDFGEGVDRWPVLAGGQGTLQDERPVKTIGSYWPYLSTVYDYVRRAMPFGNARSLSDDDVYALTAYLMFLNDIVSDEDFELSKSNFLDIPLPNEANFIADDRAEEPFNAENIEPCMKDCKPGKAQVAMRARILDVTPGNADGEGADGVQ